MTGVIAGQNGALEADRIVWTIDTLAGNGAAVELAFEAEVSDTAIGTIEVGAVQAVADDWPEPAVAAPRQAFVGEGVPIWAVQGAEDRSPLLGEDVVIVGVELQRVRLTSVYRPVLISILLTVS